MIWSKEKLESVVRESKTKKEVLEKLGLRIFAGNYNTLNKYFKQFGIDFSHFCRPKNIGNDPSNKIDLLDILVEHSTYTNNTRLKSRLISEGLLEYKCSECGLRDKWNNKPIVMILDHINGVHDDNRMENLRLLCPNCNSQTETFAGRNVKDKKNYSCEICGKKLSTKRKTNRCVNCLHYGDKFYEKKRILNKPDLDKLLKDVEELGYSGTGRKYNVAHTTISRWLK